MLVTCKFVCIFTRKKKLINTKNTTQMKVFTVLLNNFANQYEQTLVLGVFRNEIDATRCMLNYLYQYNDTELDKESWIEANIHTDIDTLDAFNGEIYCEVCELM